MAIDPKRKAEIADRLRKGEPSNSIMRACRCCRETLRNVCREFGIAISPSDRLMTDEKHAKIVNRLKAGDPIKTIARQENVGRETVKRICRATEARPLPPKNGRPQGESLRVSGEIDYKPVLEYPCENGHRTIYYPCPVCIALRANASCTPEKRKTFSQVTF